MRLVVWKAFALPDGLEIAHKVGGGEFTDERYPGKKFDAELARVREAWGPGTYRVATLEIRTYHVGDRISIDTLAGEPGGEDSIVYGRPTREELG